VAGSWQLSPVVQFHVVIKHLIPEDAMNLAGNKITWLGHATFRIETKDGATVYVDPWVMNNPMCPDSEKKVKKADALICTHGHGDHIGDAVAIVKQHQPLIVGIYELCLWLQKKGAKNISPMNKGGTQTVAGVRATMVQAVHSCGIQEDAAASCTAAKPAVMCWSCQAA